ncbi:hypothetical protein D9613_004686 [Agrocybe pediades]|uniref:F-box domain-containing protein n=1 Tax=Agrocybe pediades TaxID=84607 RepID=A0A8H4QXU8_9AGAR|nr:hypothetical protein D9613_004686 [Agrocybe pediades]
MAFLDIVMKFSRHEENQCRISDFPEELIQMIFRAYVSGRTLSRTPTKPTIRYSRWCNANVIKLLHVNRAWRRVALDTRELWSSIYMYNPSKMILDTFDSWLLIVEKLVRKKDALVDVYLESSDGYMTEHALISVFDILDRIRNLDIILPQCTLDKFSFVRKGGLIKFLRRFMCAHPSAPVERIRISLSDEIQVKRRKNLLDVWQYMVTLPNIQHIVWDYKPQLPPISELTREVAQGHLRFLEVRELTFCDMHWLLTANPALEEFRVLDDLSFDAVPDNIQPFEHPRLKALSLRGTDILPALDPYTFPSLEKLYLSYCMGTKKFGILTEFIQRSKPHITHYTFAQRYDMIMGEEDHNISHLDMCRKYLNSTIHHFALHGAITEIVAKMLMARLPDGTHEFVPTAKYLDVAVDGLEGGIVSDLVFSRAAVYKRPPPEQYHQLMRATGGEVVEFTLRRTGPYGLGDKGRLAAMEREYVVIRRLSN